MKYEKLNKISSEAVEKATGKGWDEWVEIIDKAGGAKMTHKDIAKMIDEKGWLANRSLKSAGWWCQMITVGYEYAKNRRAVGETQEQGFEIGVQKMIYVPIDTLWNFIVSSKGIKLWLGDIDNLNLENGYKYKTKDGIEGEVRTIKKQERIRLTWKKREWDKPSTLQLTLSCPRNTQDKTNLRFHQEKLTSKEQREQMRKHWQGVLEKLAKITSR